MILILHITIALAGLALAAASLISPSQNRLRATYALVALTFASGFYLVARQPAHLAQVCTEGLIYLGVVLGTSFAAQRKLNMQLSTTKSLAGHNH
jgi:hypothetical protein